MSDNRPEYIGKDFNKLHAKQQDFKHDSSSPHYPQFNGQIKRTVRTVKKTLKEAFKSNDDPYLAFLSLQRSPGPENTHTIVRTITINECKYSYDKQ